jgi:hypothetical protein
MPSDFQRRHSAKPDIGALPKDEVLRLIERLIDMKRLRVKRSSTGRLWFRFGAATAPYDMATVVHVADPEVE